MLPADPFAVLGALRSGERPFLLHSGSDADGCGGASFAGCDPFALVEWTLGDPGDPFERLAAAPNPCLAVGYLGYGLASVVEPRVPARPDPSGWPELSFAFYDAAWRLDHRTGRAELLGPGAARLCARLAGAGPAEAARALRTGPLRPARPAADHARRVRRIQEYIRAGDVYEVNLTHTLSAPAAGDPAGALGALRRFGAPFGGLLDLGRGRALVANSPERYLLAQDGRLESRPIKGTRALGPGAAAALRADEKERAEHVMIVDLVRNDLGRVSRIGSVAVERALRVVRLPTLYHLVSTVVGAARPGLGLADLLRATFPGGSVTGAPKVRAMELIAELEPEARGPYTGAFGRIGPGPGLALDLAMTIRTAAFDQAAGRLALGVGGAIVADSRPGAEWRETLLKARAFERALAGVAGADGSGQELDDRDGEEIGLGG